MQRNRFEYLCAEAEAGRDAFVRHPNSNEEGMLASCNFKSDHMVVQTPQRQTRCWDYHECEELSHPKVGPMI